MEEFGIPSVVLMENAGAGAARILLDLAGSEPEVYGPPWVILCGAGNNGGDGFVVARHLHNAGHHVEVHLAFDPGRLVEGRDNTVNLRVLEKMSLPVHPLPEDGRAPNILSSARAGTIVDALLGTGLSRDLGPPYLEWARKVNGSPAPAVALDLPTGLDAASGRVLGEAVLARRTITFAASKVGFELGEGPRCVGDVQVVDIGLPREIWESAR